MQTSSCDGWLTRPLRTGICPTPELWTTIPWREVGLGARVRRAGERTRRETVETEKLRILKMLEDKKITADEAARLIDALDRVDSRPSERELKRRWIHIRVEKDGEEHVNVRVPLALLKLGFRLAPHALAAGSAKAERHAERAHERAVKAQEKAARIKEKVRKKLQAKLGPDADLGDLNGAFDEVLEGLQEGTAGPHGFHSALGKAGLAGLDLDVEQIIRMAQEEGFDGRILDVYDDDEDRRVSIRLE
jgi:hypothetical protein